MCYQDGKIHHCDQCGKHTTQAQRKAHWLCCSAECRERFPQAPKYCTYCGGEIREGERILNDDGSLRSGGGWFCDHCPGESEKMRAVRDNSAPHKDRGLPPLSTRVIFRGDPDFEAYAHSESSNMIIVEE